MTYNTSIGVYILETKKVFCFKHEPKGEKVASLYEEDACHRCSICQKILPVVEGLCKYCGEATDNTDIYRELSCPSCEKYWG